MRGAPAPASAARRRASRGDPRACRALRPVAVSGARGRGLSAAHPVVRIDLPRGARDRNRADCAQARSVRANAVREWRIRAPASQPARRRVSRTGVRGGARRRRPSCIERRLPDRRQYSAIPCGGPPGMRRHRRRSERAARRATSPRGARRPSATAAERRATGDGHHVFMHRSSLIAHRAGGSRALQARLHAFDSCAGLANRRAK